MVITMIIVMTGDLTVLCGDDGCVVDSEVMPYYAEEDNNGRRVRFFALDLAVFRVWFECGKVLVNHRCNVVEDKFHV